MFLGPGGGRGRVALGSLLDPSLESLTKTRIFVMLLREALPPLKEIGSSQQSKGPWHLPHNLVINERHKCRKTSPQVATQRKR